MGRKNLLAALAAVGIIALAVAVVIRATAHADAPSVQQAQLTASDGAAFDYFGLSVAISGDTAVVGAFEHDVGSNGGQGSAYVYVRSGTTWTQQAKLTASDGAANDNFGVSVAIAGDTAVVGANFDYVGSNGGQGSAYVYVRSGTTWSQQAKLTASDGAAFDFFGISVAVSADTAVVGAYGGDVGSNTEQGSAYVFVPVAPLPTPTATPVPPTPTATPVPPTPTPTPVPGVSGVGLLVLAVLLVALFLRMYSRRTQQRGASGS